jgi:methyl-accepting chemotaxis protein
MSTKLQTTELQGNVLTRTVALMSHGIVLSTGLAAFIPIFLFTVALAVVVPNFQPINFLWSILAFFGGIAFGLVVYRVSYRTIDQTLTEYATVLEMVADGDLTRRLTLPETISGTDEQQMIYRLGKSVNTMLDRLQGVFSEVNRTLKRLDTDTQSILDATSRQIAMANEQDAVVTETTATVNEVRATVTETAERAQSVAETAQISVDISRSGTDAVSETISGMDLIRRRVEDIADNILVLSEHTQQIGEIIATVNNLADQSRMLALNASVEAARAGEEGKGFAVVAMEVRNLADQNRDATVQVREILGEIQRATNSAVMVTEEGSKGVDQGQMLVNKAGDSIRELARAIEDAAMAAMQIAASTRQQTIGMDQLTGAMRTIKHATTETVSSTMQVEASVQRLREAANRVNEVLGGLTF